MTSTYISLNGLIDNTADSSSADSQSLASQKFKLQTTSQIYNNLQYVSEILNIFYDFTPPCNLTDRKKKYFQQNMKKASSNVTYEAFLSSSLRPLYILTYFQIITYV